MESLAASYDEEKNADDWITRYLTLPSYVLDTVRDGSDEYFNALKEAILAITIGKYGSIDYKGYKMGICFKEQLSLDQELPHNESDIKMDELIYE